MVIHQCKVILIGDSGVGKSSLLSCFLNNVKYPDFSSTIGIDFGSKIMKINDEEVKLMIWDTAGQERFRAITRSYYRNINIAIIVYSIDNYNSFKHLTKWINELSSQSKECPIIIVGNKSDLTNNRQVSFEEGKEFSQKNNCKFMETNINDYDTCYNCFKILIEEYLIDKSINNGLTTPPIEEYYNYKQKINSIKQTCC